MLKLLLFLVHFFLSNDLRERKVFSSSSAEQKEGFIINIPTFLEHGRIVVEGRNLRDSSSVTYIFSFYPSSPHYLIDAGFFLDVQKKSEKMRGIGRLKTLTVYQVMDSLKIHDRAFLRNREFYAVFCGAETELHKLKGEYIHASYKEEQGNQNKP